MGIQPSTGLALKHPSHPGKGLEARGVVSWSGSEEALSRIHRLRRAVALSSDYPEECRLIQDHADRCRVVLEELMNRARVAQDNQSMVLIVLQEALSNAWMHGNDSQVLYRFSAQPSRVVQEYRYLSSVFSTKTPEIDTKFLTMESGKGILLIRALSNATWTFTDGAVTVRCVTTF